MKLIEADLKGVFIIEPSVYGDNRGWFMETYNMKSLLNSGIDISFVQDNHSFSATKGTLRGLHYQLNPKAQSKLVRCSKGAIYDVAVDIRKGSPAYGKWFGIELSDANKKQLFIPQGFAHGFVTLTEDAEVQYKVDEFYAADCDRSIKWNDPDIGIDWPLKSEPILSSKDQQAAPLNKAENNFVYEE